MKRTSPEASLRLKVAAQYATRGRSVVTKSACLFYLLCSLLTACDFDPGRLIRFVPEFFPIKRIAYHRTIFGTCAVAIFELHDGFGAKFLETNRKNLEGAIYLRRPTREGSDETSRSAFYGAWDETPIELASASSPLWTRLHDAYFCFKDAKDHRATFEAVSREGRILGDERGWRRPHSLFAATQHDLCDSTLTPAPTVPFVRTLWAGPPA